MTPLRATVRLQLHAGFTLHDAAARVPYFAALGVSHLYLSPIGTAVPGSTHGYDVVDPGVVNPELGGESALQLLAATARARGMGLVLDIVPNHAATHADNRWWWDVLARGRASAHADWFDIDWNAPGRGGKLWMPVLDRPFAQALAEGALTVAVDDVRGLVVCHGGQPFPLSASPVADSDRAVATHPADSDLASLADALDADRDALRARLDAQPYRLAWWRTGNDLVNYRRFFDITSLAALKMETPAAFDAVHALPLRLVRDGLVDGLRIDHVDGLADPRAYMQRLRSAVDDAARGRVAAGGVALYVEKILAPGEVLQDDWHCDGTTGYDFMDEVSGVLHDADGEAELRAAWRGWSGRTGDFAEEERAARREMLDGPLHAEFQRAVRALVRVARHDPAASELGAPLLARGLAAVMVEFPVYRTYARGDGLHGQDRLRFAQAADRARAGANPALSAAIDAVDACMREGAAGASALPARVLRRRIEHLTAPLNAKSVEDTAFYRHGVLLSRNEVGSHPTHFAMPVEAFHAACLRRQQAFPRALLLTASHDHKRGEDLRARLAVLSERPAWWRGQVDGFDARVAAQASDAGPSHGDRAMLWQTLVAAWPLDLARDDRDGRRAFAARVTDWLRKATREAKLRTTWTAPDDDYERACDAFIGAVLVDDAGDPVRMAVQAAAGDIAAAGAVNALAQASLRLTVPGVPDLYQGTEGWDLSLVDPDNRRPVDYDLRERWLADTTPTAALAADWHDGRIKARLVARLLALRQREPGLFAEGAYRARQPDDDAGRHVIAFERHHGAHTLLVAVPRHVGCWLAGSASLLPDAAHWGTACLRPSLTDADAQWHDVLHGGELDVAPGEGLRLSRLFAQAPVAVLLSSRDPRR
ncbi:MAG TPA: malto-oligosyltrehalose synthase [Luteimonas sp.]|nr:malto-oligosyltrehalose synthase [Luteimonas sp.]